MQTVWFRFLPFALFLPRPISLSAQKAIWAEKLDQMQKHQRYDVKRSIWLCLGYTERNISIKRTRITNVHAACVEETRRRVQRAHSSNKFNRWNKRSDCSKIEVNRSSSDAANHQFEVNVSINNALKALNTEKSEKTARAIINRMNEWVWTIKRWKKTPKSIEKGKKILFI